LSLSSGGPKSIEEMVLELAPDEDKAIFRKRSLQKWDAKKKKYIQAESVADKKKMFIKNESGSVVKKSPGDKKGGKVDKTGKLYNDWMQKTNRYIPTVGAIEDSDRAAMDVTPRAAMKFKHNKAPTEAPTRGGRGGKFNARPVKNELKSMEDIQKSRNEAAKKQFRGRGGGGPGGGRGGGRGGSHGGRGGSRGGGRGGSRGGGRGGGRGGRGGGPRRG